MRGVRNFGLIAAGLWLVAGSALGEQPAITVYNQNFGVVRERVRLDLQAGVNPVTFTEITAHLEPDSVILRDPSGRRRLQILEQNYRADPLSQGLLLSLFEGQTIDILAPTTDNPDRILRGKIIRSGYVPHQAAWNVYGYDYMMRQSARSSYDGGGQPIVEIDGQIRFGLPGAPLFPSLADDTVLEPTLHWLIETDAGGPLEAELSYVTGGMSWKADYNVVEADAADRLDLVGWVTIDNQSGRDFRDARIKLMAGDVSRVGPESSEPTALYAMSESRLGGMMPPVSEKSFDEYHLYTLQRETTLRDRETKQVEFLRAADVAAQKLYVYDGVQIGENYRGWNWESVRNEPSYGTQSNPKVWVVREIENTQANHLGMPLPAGRVRFYRRDDDGRLEFTGENSIDHTPKDETLRIYTGNAFDLVGERRRTRYNIDHNNRWLIEAFELKVRNHKDEAVEVRIVEHLYRWFNWELTEASHEHRKLDAQRIEFPVQVEPDGEVTVTYEVKYTW